MFAPNGAGLASAATDNEARIDLGTGKSCLFSRTHIDAQPLFAELTGSDTCTSAGVTAQGSAPALLLCRQLLAQGVDPDTALTVFRNGTLALRIRSIAEGAALTVEDSRFGQPVFRPYRYRGVGMALPVPKTGRGR